MLKNKNEAKFIVFEGFDGSGQSTQAKLLADYLSNEKDIQVLLTKEPTKESESGIKIREILQHKQKSEPAELQKLFAQDRYEHIEKEINPALVSGKFVISDRYFFSTLAFGASDGLDLDWLIRLNDGFLYPDLTIILRVSPESCMKRLENRGGERKLFEKSEKLAKVWETYQILPERFRDVVIIDGEESIEEVHEDVKKAVQERILAKFFKLPNL